MKSIAHAQKEIERRLRNIGIEREEAAAEAKLILEDIVGQTRTFLLLNASKTLTVEQASAIEQIIDKREARVPIQYCLGHAWFMDMKLIVREGVFIPRPDTEILVEVTEEIIKQEKLEAPQLAEIGIGSGAISIALLRAVPDLKMVACDLSETALAVTRENARNYAVEDRLTLIEGDWRTVLPGGLQGIISNPPYIPRSQQKDLQPEVGLYEPDMALFGTDEDGLGFYRDIANSCRNLLKDGTGFVVVEVGDGQEAAVRAIFAGSNCNKINIHEDMNRLPRAVSARVQ